MSVLALPPQDELELLIREARARQRRRWLIVAAVIGVLAGATLGIDSAVTGGTPRTSRTSGPAAGVQRGKKCGIRVDNMRIVDSGGRTLFREPGNWSRSYPHPSVVRCSGPSIWIVWDNGAAAMQEGYVGAHSSNGGRTWKLVFAEPYFGVKAPHALDSYMGPWTVRGTAGYFAGFCPACGRQPTVSLWVTTNGGQTFRRYDVTSLERWWPVAIRIKGNAVIIVAQRGSRRKAAAIRVG